MYEPKIFRFLQCPDFFNSIGQERKWSASSTKSACLGALPTSRSGGLYIWTDLDYRFNQVIEPAVWIWRNACQRKDFYTRPHPGRGRGHVRRARLQGRLASLDLARMRRQHRRRTLPFRLKATD